MPVKKKNTKPKKSPAKKVVKKTTKAKKPKLGLLSYSANNSGGYWWLQDEHWKKLEAAGWKVEWVKGDRWLGALAKACSKRFATADEGVSEWRSITNQDPWNEGCNCCGPPHNFTFEDAQGGRHYAETITQTRFGGWT